MKCFNCKVEVPHTFAFALSENKCPGCGKEILDEETQALKSDIAIYIGSSIALKKETLDKLAMMLISRYDIQFGNALSKRYMDSLRPETSTELVEEEVIEVREKISEEDVEEEIRKLKKQRAKEAQDKELDNLRGEVLREALEDKYGLSFQEREDDAASKASPTDFGEEDLPAVIRQKMQEGATNVAPYPTSSNINIADDVNPFIQAEYLKQKVKGARAIEGSGDGPFRRAAV